jgi:hypothetical protein
MPAAARGEGIDALEELGPGGLGLEQDVVGAVERHELGAGNEGRE